MAATVRRYDGVDTARVEESTRPVAAWVRVEELESALPHPPAIPSVTAAVRRSAEGGLAGVVQPSTFRSGGPAQVPVLQWPTMLKGGRMAMLAQLVARLRGALKK